MSAAPETLAPAAADLTPAERVFSEPGRLSAVVLQMLDFAREDVALLTECAGVHAPATVALIASQANRRLGRIRREIEAARGGETLRA